MINEHLNNKSLKSLFLMRGVNMIINENIMYFPREWTLKVQLSDYDEADIRCTTI